MLARGELQLGAAEEECGDSVADALAAFGLVLEEGDVPALPDAQWHLWPECLPALELFLSLQTQWVVGMAGPVGLSYPSAEALLRLQCRSQSERRERFAEIQCLERGWLQGWREKQDKKGRGG